MNEFFKLANELFKKEISKEKENEIIRNENAYKHIKENLIPQLEKIFKDYKEKIIKIFSDGKYTILGMLNEEILYADQKLKEADNDVEKAIQKIKEKLEIISKELNEKQTDEMKKFENDIENLIKEETKNLLKKKNLNLDKLTIKNESGFDLKKLIQNIFFEIYKGLGYKISVMEYSIFSISIIFSFIITPFFAILTFVNLISFIYYIFSKSRKYKKNLESLKEKTKNDFEEKIKTFETDFLIINDEFFKIFNMKLGVVEKKIKGIDKNKWENIKKEYNVQKNEIQEMFKRI